MEISVTADGASSELLLGEGEYVIGIEAVTWGGASVTLQETVGDTFVNSVDPYSPAQALTRTANGPLVVAHGGSRIRLNTSGFTLSTAGLRLIAVRSSTNVGVVVPVNANSIRTGRIASNPLVIRKSANLKHTINDTGELLGVTRLVFTVKDDLNLEADAAAVIQVSTSIPADVGNDGILILEGAAGGAERTSGSLAIVSYVENGTTMYRLEVNVKDTATALLNALTGATFDVKYFTSAGSFILDEGPAVIEHSTTRTTS